jgi:hypothetical protein
MDLEKSEKVLTEILGLTDNKIILDDKERLKSASRTGHVCLSHDIGVCRKGLSA